LTLHFLLSDLLQVHVLQVLCHYCFNNTLKLSQSNMFSLFLKLSENIDTPGVLYLKDIVY